jgi:hypothetical protein
LSPGRHFSRTGISPRGRPTFSPPTTIGILNFGGFSLTLWEVSESYENDEGIDTPYFPATSAMVTAPDCGHLMYGQITQIDHGNTEYTTYPARRVPKFMNN